MDVNLGISGPVDKLVITGPVNLSNGDLAGFNLKQKLGALSSFAGLGGNSGGGNDTQIQKLSADVRVDPSGTQANNVDLIVPSIGTVTGNAAVSAENKLSGKMMAKLAAGSVAGAMTGALSSFTGGGASKGGAASPLLFPAPRRLPFFSRILAAWRRAWARLAQERLVARLVLPAVPLEPLAAFSAKRKSSESLSVSLETQVLRLAETSCEAAVSSIHRG